MPKKISEEKESQIVNLFFQVKNQKDIGKSLNVAQSTVSRVLKDIKSLPESSFYPRIVELGAEKVVNDLYRLAVKLKKNKCTISMVEEGYRLFETLKRSGAGLDKIPMMISVFDEINDLDFPLLDFLSSISDILRLQKEEGKTYRELLQEYQEKTRLIARLDDEIEEKTKEIGELKQEIEYKREELGEDLTPDFYP